MLDADGEPQKHGFAASPDMVKPNSPECARLLGCPVNTDEEALAAVDQLYERMGGGEKIALVSRGKRGAVMRCSEGRFLGRSPEVEVLSTIGSGDSLLGAFLWATTSGLSLSDAMAWGLAAGAATACTSGGEIARRQRVEELRPFAEVVAC